MENIKKYSCWECKHFAPEDAETSRAGYCRRYAPHSLDYHGCNGGGAVSPLTTKGDVYSHDGATDARQAVGTDGQVLSANSAQPNGLEWIDPQGDPSPLTTKGDVYSHDGATDARQAVGTDGQVLSANSAQPNGLEWIDPQGDASPLTTKGDLYSHDGANNTRQPIGTDGQVLSANSAQPNGIEWINPTAGSSPLTTKGDLYGFSTTDERLPIGTPGQIIQADPAEPMGVKWVDVDTGLAYLDTEQAARFDSVQQTWALFSRDGEPAGSGGVKAISNPNTQYDNAGTFPFITAFDAASAEVVAIQVCLTSMAVGGGTVGANPYILIRIYEIDGSSETEIGTVNFPVDPANVAINNNLGTPNYQNMIYNLVTNIPITAGGMWGWRFDLASGADTSQIGACRNINVKFYLSITPTPTVAALRAKLFAQIEATPATTSTEKWAFISEADLGWCGDFERNPATAPPLPTP